MKGTRVLFKETVKIGELTDAMAWMLKILKTVADFDPVPSALVITSANDSKHQANSRHYSNEALDLRSKNFLSANKEPFRRLLEAQLNSHPESPDSFVVIFEGEGTDNEHFHVQVKRGMRFYD